MSFANPMQKFQDWCTQQWVIMRGQKINVQDTGWLMGPFGNTAVIGKKFINTLAEKEQLQIKTNTDAKGLIPSMQALQLSNTDWTRLSKPIIEFYENTMQYNLDFTVKWNPIFKFFGILVNTLFSRRINQLNIPTRNGKDGELLKSEIIHLVHPGSGEVKYTFWLRTIASSGRIVYSGAYGLATLPGGKTCIKAVFPLPNGNATVLMAPSTGDNGELILDASGRKFGDAGFYFLLKDSKGTHWTKYIRSFRDRLVITDNTTHLSAEQLLTLWRLKVLSFRYRIDRKKNESL